LFHKEGWSGFSAVSKKKWVSNLPLLRAPSGIMILSEDELKFPKIGIDAIKVTSPEHEVASILRTGIREVFVPKGL
jgi:hypothetical protein